ncbi:Ig-like domain repeat protein [Archangium violaceum]|uniref:Ig-like domain-containing protein n=1 Tax=Archangium violaceum TaxID=83451 RepID=UPI0019510823|nr:Ig-like domain-containing protein [Archangium violaceum]QRN98484.1 Ig-like domain repeat protein [Archangium violaceum]
MCNIPSPACDTTTLLLGRGAVGPEANAPNTLGASCADGDDGTFHSAASVDAIRVSSQGGSALTAGQTVTVSVDVWGAPEGGSSLMLFQAADARAPQWVHLETLATTGGAQTLSASFVLPEGGLQAVRATLVDASQASGAPCTPGTVHDHDDLAFAVASSGPAAPWVVLTAPADGATVSGLLTVSADTFDADGISRVDFYVGTTALSSDFQPPYEMLLNTRYSHPNGSYTLTARAYDTAGNSTTSKPVVITVDNDTTQPTVVSVLPGISATVSSTVTLGAEVTDDRGIDRVEFRIDDVQVGSDNRAPYSVTWDSFSVANGEHDYDLWVWDLAGNLKIWGTNMYVRNDYAAPVVRLTWPQEGSTLGGFVSVIAEASDDIGITRVEFYLDDTVLIGTSTQAQYGTPWNTRTASGGPHTLTARAHDASGKVTTSAPLNVIVDPPPTAAVSSPTAGSVLTGTVSLTAAVTDNLGVTQVDFRVGDTTIACNAYSPNYSCNWSTRLHPNGPIQVRAEASDAAGNRTYSEWVTFTLNNDLLKPAVALTSPAQGATVSGVVTVSADASDDRGVTQVDFYAGSTWIGNDTTAPFSINWSSTQLANGTYALKARARDAAFNYAESALVNVTVDNDLIAPTVTFTSPTQGATLLGGATLTVDASDDRGISKVELYLGSTLLTTDTSAPYAYDLNTRGYANGAYSLTAKAYDSAGNMSSTTVNVTLNNDFTAPTVSFSWPTGGAILSGTVTLAALASDDRSGVSKVEFFLGSTPLSTDTTAPYESSSLNTRNYANGTYVLTAKAHDAWGNVGSASVNVTLRNDFAVPTVSITSPTAGSTVTGGVSILASASDDLGVTRVEFYVDGALIGTDTTSPYSVAWDSSTFTGSRSLQARAYDAVGNVGTSAAVTVNVSAGTGGSTAVYDSTLKAPRCYNPSRNCSSGNLLNGRGGLGPEANAPNTLGNSCADSNSGTYHSDESIDAISVSSLDGMPMTMGRTVRIEVKVWAYSNYSSDQLDLYYSSSATNPSWKYLTTLTPSGAGQQTLTATYTLPLNATTQAVRAHFRYGGSPSPCATGSFDDHDDLAFYVTQ